MEFAKQFTISAVDVFYGYSGSLDAGTSDHQVIESIASVDNPVIIAGESGLYKSSVLNTIHSHSGRSKKICGHLVSGLPSEIQEAEIHGLAENSSEPASPGTKGQFEQSDGGSLILARFHKSTAQEQSAIATVLESGRVTPLGGEKTVPFNVRFMCSSYPDVINPASAVVAYVQKANGFLISILPLRSTPEDVPRLAQRILSLYTPRKYFGDKVLAALSCQHWPGNLEHLKNLIQKVHITTPSDIIEIGHVQATLDDNQFDTEY